MLGSSSMMLLTHYKKGYYTLTLIQLFTQRNPLKQPFPPGIISNSLPMNSTRETILWSSWQQDLKNYAYNTKQGKQTCKVRGFTLNAHGQRLSHFNSMKELVINEILEPEDEPRTFSLHTPHKITRCTATKTLHSVAQDKKYKLVFDKRVVEHDTYQSFLHGYKCISTSQM